MTQILVTLENDADSTFLQRMIENMKGVRRTSIQKKTQLEDNQLTEQWISQMKELSDSVDSSIIDMSDERTRYIMSK